MKDIKKLLAENREQILPDDGVKQSIKDRLGYIDAPQTPEYAQGGVKTDKKRNLIFALTATALAIILCLAIVLPIALGKRGDDPFNDKFSDITDAHSFYAYGAASVGSILASDDGRADTAATFSRAVYASAVDTDDLDPYISLVDSLLADGSIVSEDIAGADGYEFGMTVKCVGLSGEITSYSMYYDKIFIKDKHKDGEYESSYSINGVLHAGDGVYPVEGTYEAEAEKDEQECELYFKAYTKSDKKSFIEVKRESETEKGEQEYEYLYSVYEGGKLIEKTAVKYESEEGETEIEIAIEKNGQTQKIKFERQYSNGQTVLSGKGEINGNKVKFRVYQTNGDRRYEFYD